jgi:hypothetical protein
MNEIDVQLDQVRRGRRTRLVSLLGAAAVVATVARTGELE